MTVVDDLRSVLDSDAVITDADVIGSTRGQEQGARAAFDGVVAAALEIGGTVTGEYGIGLLKARHLEDELDSAALRMHRAIKHALDPQGILNPGKVVRGAQGGWGV